MSLGSATVLLQRKTWTDKHLQVRRGLVSSFPTTITFSTGLTRMVANTCVFVNADDCRCSQAAPCPLRAGGYGCPNTRTSRHDTFTRQSHISLQITSHGGKQLYAVISRRRRSSFLQLRATVLLRVCPPSKRHL